MIRNNNLFLLFTFLTFGVLAGCDANRIMEENHEIPSSTWTLDNLQQFQFQISDTNLRYNFVINVRNTNSYNDSNLYLFVELTGPDDRTYRDTLEVLLADNTGRWLGSGVGNVWQNRVNFLKGVQLNTSGKYSIVIGHGMRDDALEGVTDIGFRVEKI